MERKVYYNVNNRSKLIEQAEALGQRLKEDAITFDDGNYLIFTDEADDKQYIAELENQVLLLENEKVGGIL